MVEMDYETNLDSADALGCQEGEPEGAEEVEDGEKA